MAISEADLAFCSTGFMGYDFFLSEAAKQPSATARSAIVEEFYSFPSKRSSELFHAVGFGVLGLLPNIYMNKVYHKRGALGNMNLWIDNICSLKQLDPDHTFKSTLFRENFKYI